MNKVYVFERKRDGKRVEFSSEYRNGKVVYIIHEAGGQSQDSVTSDLAAVDAFREGLLRDGYMQIPLDGSGGGG
ncbi:MAG: hypothetical protein JOZ39_12405 [Chloroflexi bacterium]|nr:hypothetical protein [Chloroflexota bacterium]